VKVSIYKGGLARFSPGEKLAYVEDGVGSAQLENDIYDLEGFRSDFEEDLVAP